MSETVKITRAEVITLKKNDSAVLREFKMKEGGTAFNFGVQTRVNDKIDRSPLLFRKCVYFAKTAEEESKIRKLVTRGSLLEVEGVTNRKSYDDKQSGNKVYYDEITVHHMTAIQVGENREREAAATNDLPF